VPVVALWQGTSPLEFPTADADDRAGIWAGLGHLESLGHRRIAFVSAELPGNYRVREIAYLDFMRDRFGEVPTGYLQECPNTLAGGDAALRRLLALPEPPTAVATSTDLVAVGVLHAAHSLGASVPERLSVVGFDDILIAAHTVPALSTLRMPISEIVGQAVATAVNLARDPESARDASLTVFSPTLIIRDSTAALFGRGRRLLLLAGNGMSEQHAADRADGKATEQRAGPAVLGLCRRRNGKGCAGEGGGDERRRNRMSDQERSPWERAQPAADIAQAPLPPC